MSETMRTWTAADAKARRKRMADPEYKRLVDVHTSQFDAGCDGIMYCDCPLAAKLRAWLGDEKKVAPRGFRS